MEPYFVILVVIVFVACAIVSRLLYFRMLSLQFEKRFFDLEKKINTDPVTKKNYEQIQYELTQIKCDKDQQQQVLDLTHVFHKRFEVFLKKEGKLDESLDKYRTRISNQIMTFSKEIAKIVDDRNANVQTMSSMEILRYADRQRDLEADIELLKSLLI